MNAKTPLVVLALLTGVYTKTALAQSWERVSHPAFSSSVDFVRVHPERPDTIFAGASGTLYTSSDRGANWMPLLRLSSGARLHDLRARQNQIFLLTSSGLFESRDFGARWEQTYSGLSDLEEEVFTIEFNEKNPKTIYLGTGSGLFQSADGGRTWHKMWNELMHTQIHKLTYDPLNEELFIASSKGVYRLLPSKKRLERVFAAEERVVLAVEEGLESDDSLEEAAVMKKGVRALTLKAPGEMLALGAESGVSMSEDEGSSWESLSDSGLFSTEVLDLIYLGERNALVAGTREGVFIYDEKRKLWSALPRGLAGASIRNLAVARGNSETLLYAATTSGLYRLVIDIFPGDVEGPNVFQGERLHLFRRLIVLEPTAREVQEKAIRYANVKNFKTRSWQWASRLRALVPTLSVGKDFATSNSIDIDRGSTSEPDKYILGPPDTSESWDASLDWNLSDLIWSPSQTSIDSRDKLMVELREEILSQATRIYFERRRAQLEFVIRPPLDPLFGLERLLRIDELTASLDALTDGFLSKSLALIYARHPELESLWGQSPLGTGQNEESQQFEQI